jgi:hypothetical protein
MANLEHFGRLPLNCYFSAGEGDRKMLINNGPAFTSICITGKAASPGVAPSDPQE